MSASIFDPYSGDAAAPLVERRFLDFLKDFSSAAFPSDLPASADAGGDDGGGRTDYVAAVRAMREHDASTLYIDYSHLRGHDAALAGTVAAEFYRFEPVLRRAVTELVRLVEPGEEAERRAGGGGYACALGIDALCRVDAEAGI